MARQPLVGQGLIIEASRFRHTTLGRTPLHKWSARRRDLYMTTHNTHKRHPWPGGIRTRNSSKLAAADPHLLPCDHWDRPNCFITNIRYQTWFANAIRKPVTTQNWQLCQLWYVIYSQYVITEQAGRRCKAGKKKRYTDQRLRKMTNTIFYYLYSFTVHFRMSIRFLPTYALLLWLKYHTNSHLCNNMRSYMFQS